MWVSLETELIAFPSSILNAAIFRLLLPFPHVEDSVTLQTRFSHSSRWQISNGRQQNLEFRTVDPNMLRIEDA